MNHKKTEAELNEMSVVDLRKLAAEEGIGTGVWRSGIARKSDLVNGLLGRDLDAPAAAPAAPAAPAGMASAFEVMIRTAADQAIAAQIALHPPVGLEVVREMVREAVSSVPPREIRVVLPTGEEKNVGRQHFLFPLLLAYAGAGVSTFLVGPAGSGKTHVVHEIAKSLGLSFGSISVCSQTSSASLCGYMNAAGGYVGTEFRRRFEDGGIFLLDEGDNGNANTLSVLNSGLANSGMAFPDKMVARHDRNLIWLAGNTFGSGACRQYVGRNQLDAATLDRFAFIEFPYDVTLEAELSGSGSGSGSGVTQSCDLDSGGLVTKSDWLSMVCKIRAGAEKNNVRVVVSPRASMMGSRLIDVGVGKNWLIKSLLRKGLDDATWDKIGGGAI